MKSADSTACRNQESDDTDTSADSLKLKLGGRDLSHQKINPNHWIVHGKKFDLTSWMHKHPGGQHSISFGKGRECTALVEQYHPHSDKVWQVLKKYEVKEEGQDTDSDEAWPPKDPFYEDLKQAVRDHFPEGYKTTKGTSRVFKLWLFGTIGMMFLLYNMIVKGNIMAAFLAGCLYVVVHCRILHEGSHFSLSPYQTMNRFISYLYSFPTICITSWELQHVINHHQYTNYMPEEDGVAQLADIDIVSYDMVCDVANKLPVSRWLWSKLVLFVIPIVFVFSPVVLGPNNAQSLLRRSSIIHESMSVQVKSHQKFAYDALFLLLIQASIIGYMAYAHGVLRAAACWIAYLFGNGMLFVTFSQVSHIPCLTENWRPTASKMKSWAAGQVEHSMNFAQDSNLAFYLSFGLNFQIEHHLFPGISHDHYEALSPKIQQVCKNHGVHYWSEPSLSRSVGILYESIVDLKDRTPVEFDSKKSN